MWGFPSADSLVQDLRYAARVLRNSPGSTTVAVLSLAIGIGTAAAVFSLADAVLLRELPVRDPGRLALVRWSSGPRLAYTSLDGNSRQTDSGYSSTSFPLAAFTAMRDGGARAGQVFGFASLGRTHVVIDGPAELVEAQVVSGNYFDALGIVPHAGRLIAPHDDRPSAHPAAVISHSLWERRFGGASGAVGRGIVVNGVPFTITGVLPRAFRGVGQIGDAPEIVVPFSFRGSIRPGEEAPDDPRYWWVVPMVRLAPGVTPDAARAVYDVILRQAVAASSPELAPGDLPRLSLEPGARGQMERRTAMREPVRIMALVVFGVLLAACANVANLLLARGRARVHEMTVRAAIGAPRGRLVRQLVTEGLVLSLCGSVGGLVFAEWLAAALLPALTRSSTPLAIDVAIDLRVLGFTALLAVACTLASALVPALKSSHVRLSPALTATGRGVAGRRRGPSLASNLVVVQVGLCLLLVATAGLLVRSVQNLQDTPLGFDPRDVLLIRVAPVLNGYEGERLRTYYSAALERLSGVPGVRAATIMSWGFLTGSSHSGVILMPGEQLTAAMRRDHDRIGFRQAVSDTFFTVFGLPVVSGRSFGPGDALPSNVQPVVVSRALAERYFPDGSAVGRRFFMSGQPGSPVHEIIGIAADVKHAGIREGAYSTVYHHYLHLARGQATFAVKTHGDPTALVPALRAALAAVDPHVPAFDVRTQEAQVRESLRTERLFAQLAGLVGGIVLLLAAVGLYGVVSYSVERRRAEIGVRMALGAERAQVQRMVLRESLVLAAAGIALGVPLAMAGARAIETVLFGLEPTDPATLGAAAALLLALALAAAYVPARRAAGVDPIAALRAE